MSEKITKRCALYRKVGDLSWDVVWCTNEGTDESCDRTTPDGYVRVTAFIDVEFPALERGPVVEQQLEQLAKAETRLRNEFQASLNGVSDMRSKLLALTDESAS